MPDKPKPIQRGFHSITFTNGSQEYHTWRDWHLVPTSRPIFVPAGVKSKTVDVPGAHGALDLSEILTGYPLYSNRNGSFEFIVIHDPNLIDGDYSNEPYPFVEWDSTYYNIANTLHGNAFYATLDDDPRYSYYGRFAMADYKTGKEYSTVTINYDVGPFKLSASSLDNYEWDPFYFGIPGTDDRGDETRNSMRNIQVNNQKNINVSEYTSIIGSKMQITPTITVSKNMTITYNSEQFNIASGGPVKVHGMVFDPLKGVDPVLGVSVDGGGSGTISIDFRKGYL